MQLRCQVSAYVTAAAAEDHMDLTHAEFSDEMPESLGPLHPSWLPEEKHEAVCQVSTPVIAAAIHHKDLMRGWIQLPQIPHTVPDLTLLIQCLHQLAAYYHCSGTAIDETTVKESGHSC